MKILEDLKKYENHCLETCQPQVAELVYNAQETIQVLIEDRARLIAAAEYYINAVYVYEKNSESLVSYRRELLQAIKEAKGE